MSEKVELTCYVGAGDNNEMWLGNKKDAFKEEYIKFLNILWNCENDLNKQECKGIGEKGPYVDPDSMGDKGLRANPKFYKKLCEFLQTRDKNYTEGSKFIEYGEVKLVSDQFGFSAPSLELSHPYDRYLRECKADGKDKDETIEKVANWVIESRTIGGSFLWPEGIWTGYNTERGGSTKKRGGSFIEDRVDLTLYEIKHYLENKKVNDGTILSQKIKDGSEEKNWLDSFHSFKEYVEFFCFEPFVQIDGDDCEIYDIVEFAKSKKDCCIDEKKYDYYKDREKNSIYNLGTEELERMFNKVNDMIIERSELMTKIITQNS